MTHLDPAAVTILTRARAILAGGGWLSGAEGVGAYMSVQRGPGDRRLIFALVALPLKGADLETARFCAAGAIEQAAAERGWRGTPAVDDARLALSSVIAGKRADYGMLAPWNDAAGRRLADVLAAFDAAIINASGK